MLPKNEKEALVDVDDRIAMLERRLGNAKAARDAFVHHLRGKYPNWTPPLPAMSYQEADFPSINPTPTNFPNREPLQSRLSTGDYQWDVDEPRGNKNRMTMRRTPMLSSSLINSPIDIPTSGPLLESDIRRSRIRLREISEELRSLRVDRMALTTEQWFQERPFREREHRSISLHFAPRSHQDHPPEEDHLEQARVHLARIDLTETSPIQTPTEERKIEIEMSENHEKLLQEMRDQGVGVVNFDEQAPPTFSQAPPTSHVRFQDTVPIAQPVVIAQPDVAQAPVQAPPPPAQVPPPNVASAVSNLFSHMNIDDDSDDSPRRAPPTFAPTSSTTTTKLDYSSLLQGIGGLDSDSDDGLGFSRPSKSKSAPAKKSMMFQDDDSDVDEFFR